MTAGILVVIQKSHLCSVYSLHRVTVAFFRLSKLDESCSCPGLDRAVSHAFLLFEELIAGDSKMKLFETVASLQTIRQPFGAARCVEFWWFSRAVVFALHVACPRQSAH